MDKKKVLKIIGIVVLVIVAIFFIHTIRNFIIVKGLQDNITKYKESTNYHIKIISKEPNNIEMITNYYKKDNKQATIVKRINNGILDTTVSKYGKSEEGKFNTYIERGETKVAIPGDGVSLSVSIYNGVERDSVWNTLFSSMFAYIRSEKVNGKDCYVINNFPSIGTVMEYYVEKDTGLLIKSIMNDIVSERDFEFNNVDDNVFIEPDISEYTIQEN